MGNAHGLQTLIEAAAQLQNSAPNILFLLVGEGAEKEQLVSLVRSRGLTNLRFVDQQSRERIPAYICASDAVRGSAQEVRDLQDCHSQQDAGVHVLRPSGDSRGRRVRRAQILEEAQAGICIEPENPSQLAEAVLRLAGDAQLRETLGRNGRRHVLQHFSTPPHRHWRISTC